jgi:hypothetical protein
VRGDGTLADFPTSTGGGSSVSYYLNSSVSQGTIGGVAYRQLSKTPISGAGTDITASTNGYIASYITDANDPALLEIPAGNFNCEFYFSVNSNNHNPYVYAELYKYDGTTFTLLGTSQSIPEYLTNGTTLSAYYFAIPVAVAALTITDRLAIRIYANVDTKIVTLHTENNHLCQVVTTFSKGLTSLNNLTRQVQFLATGTSGTDFAISSSTATHTFNLPVASATNTGKLSSTDWSTFNNKLSTATAASTYVPYTGATGSVNLGLYELSAQNAFLNGVSGVNGGNLFLRQDIDFGQSAGYTTLYSTGKNLGFVSYVGSFTYNALFSLNSLTNNSTRTYTFPDASGTIALTSQLTGGTVTSVAALTIGTSGTDLSSSVANSTTTPVITLNVPTASATNRGALSSADWTTFNNKYNLPTFSNGSILFIKFSTIAENNPKFFWNDTNSYLGIGTNVPTAGVTSFSSTPATQFKAAGVAPAMTFSNTLTAATYAAVFGLATSNNDFVSGTATGDFAIANQSTSAGAIVFGTGTTERMRMTSAGTFSIGNTNSSFNLDVTGTGRFTTTLTANKLVAGNASTDNVAIFTTYDEGKALQLKGSTGDLIFVPYFNPSIGAKIIAQNTAGSANTPLSLIASSINLLSPLSGTSATFSSSVTANTFVEIVGDLRFNSNSADRSIYFRGTAGSPDTNWKMGTYITPTGATVVTSAATVIDVFNGAGYGFMVRNTSNAPLLQIAGNTGAATFSSSVTSPVIKLSDSTLSGAGNFEFTSEAFFGARFQSNAYKFMAGNNSTEYMRITSGGNVGIGTTGSAWDTVTNLQVLNASLGGFFGNTYLGANTYYGSGGWKYITTDFSSRIELAGGGFEFYTAPSGTAGSAVSFSRPMVITSGSQVITTMNAVNNPVVIEQTSTNPYGPWFKFTTDINNGTNYYWVASALVSGNEFVRAKLLSNGGLANYQSNNTNLSDERTKKDIIPLESYWDKFKAIEIVKFKYKDQTHDDFNIGVIAQQVESVAPEFVDIDGWDNKLKLDEDGNEIISDDEPLKSIYTADLHHATIKVLQECMSKIEEQQAQIEELKQLILNK